MDIGTGLILTVLYNPSHSHHINYIREISDHADYSLAFMAALLWTQSSAFVYHPSEFLFPPRNKTYAGPPCSIFARNCPAYSTRTSEY